ncbi:hypothetical protein F5B18DRAFT_673064 [Nemania serpens]|nr:hypothetical protein F5B18DRAFT_673064 [Nemania serpens]
MSQPARPDDAEDPDDYIPVREKSLRKNITDSLTKKPPKTDREINEYDDYLRRKWGCTEAIPDSFDPDKLDAVLKSRLSGTRIRGRPNDAAEKTAGPVVSKGDDTFMTPVEPQDTPPEDTSSSIPNDTSAYGCYASQTSLLAHSKRESLNKNSKVEKYEGGVSIHKNETPPTLKDDTTHPRPQPSLGSPRCRDRSMSDTPGQALPPRIRTGSKPPLSRSAFVAGGVPCLHEKCHGACKRGVIVKGHVRPPQYFPFKSQARRPSRSRDNGKRRVDTDSP